MTQIFETYHPTARALYFAGVIACTMIGTHPVLATMSVTGGICFSVISRGIRHTLKQLIWILPMLLLIVIINPIISGSGSTVITRAFGQTIYLESIIYGICAGGMLVATILWFSNATSVLSSSVFTSLLGNKLPTVGIMCAMTLREVPQFVWRGREITNTQRANTARKTKSYADTTHKSEIHTTQACNNSGHIDTPRRSATKTAQTCKYTNHITLSRKNTQKTNKRSHIAKLAHNATTLMAWGMEDSLQTATSMQARGWGAWNSGAGGCTTYKRTTYERTTFQKRDTAQVCILGLIVALSIAESIYTISQFRFYPSITGFVPWYVYVPYGLLLMVPFVIVLKDAIDQKRAKR